MEAAWLDRFLGMLPHCPSVFDLGCGTDEPIARYLADRDCGVRDVELAPEMIAICQDNLSQQTWRVAESQVVVSAGKRTIYTAGQVAIDERGELVGGSDLAAQTEQAMRNVGLALAAAGAGCADIVKISTYVVNYKPERRAVIGRARSPFFAGGKPPASTLVGVSALALPEWLVEIEAVAVVD